MGSADGPTLGIEVVIWEGNVVGRKVGSVVGIVGVLEGLTVDSERVRRKAKVTLDVDVDVDVN